MRQNKSSNQKKEKQIRKKLSPKQKRTLFNRAAMGVMIILLFVVVVYSVKSMHPVDLSDIGNRPFKGNPNSKVIISEFADFQCPACRGAEPTVKQLLADYPDKIKLVFYNYPLVQVHPWAILAANAAQCANDQGKFWSYHDLLFDRQDIWVKDSNPGKLFRNYAVELGLNSDSFNSCLDQEKNKSVISEDMDKGDSLQVNSTPTIFVNNKQRFLAGSSLLSDLKQAVDNELSLRS